MTDTEDKTENLEMAQLLSEHEKEGALLSKGGVVMARVVEITDEGALVDVGLKSEAVVPKRELSPEALAEIRVGADIPVVRVPGATSDGRPLVSYQRAKESHQWVVLAAAKESGASVTGKVVKRIKGGFLFDVGVPAFLPASQLDLRPPKDLDAWVGRSLEVAVTELDRRRRNAVVSRRKLLEEQQRALREKTMSGLEVGRKLSGTVKSLASFGAFVDVGGMEGLLHLSDISWQRIRDAKEKLRPGQKVEVVVLQFDPATQKLSLGLKQLTPHPWEGLEERFPLGSLSQGKVTSLAAFGAFVELSPGLEGLIHLSELSWTKRARHPKEILKSGQTVTVKVIGLDREKEKLSLSLKQAEENPWLALREKYPAGTKLEGEVTSLVAFGAFVRLPFGMEGLLHVSDMSWGKRLEHPKELLKSGDKITVVILEIEAASEKISLGLKQLTQDPFQKYKLNDAVEGTVKALVPSGAVVVLDNGLECFLPSIETDGVEEGKQTSQVLAVGQRVKAKVTRVHKRERRLEVSSKRYERDEDRRAVKRYMAENSGTHTLGDILGMSGDDENPS